MKFIDNATKNSSKADVVSAAGRRLRLFVVLLFLCAGRLLPSSSAAADTGKNLATEYQLKAAFLYNFMKFVEWPNILSNPQSGNSETKKEPLRVCVLGENNLKDPLNSLSEKTIKDRPVKIEFIDSFEELKKKHGDASVEDYLEQIQKTIVSCHLLFVGASEKERLAEILKLSEKKPI
ncbi:MAG TPA: YfiR family protein [Anaerohalosphaeraceae bacterium]|nr:YfiR family protein [Anaerohalosphaeraceae bacterium]